MFLLKSISKIMLFLKSKMKSTLLSTLKAFFDKPLRLSVELIRILFFTFVVLNAYSKMIFEEGCRTARKAQSWRQRTFHCIKWQDPSLAEWRYSLTCVLWLLRKANATQLIIENFCDLHSQLQVLFLYCKARFWKHARNEMRFISYEIKANR